MFFVYAIRSLVKNYTYVGLTENVERRFSQHNNGYEKTTNPYKPFKVIFTEEFPTRDLARKKEKYLKSGVEKNI